MVTLYQKVEMFAILGAAFPPREPIGMKFCVAKWTHVPLGHAKFCESVQRVAIVG